MKLPKKGNLCECTNWRGIITLLPVISKIFGRVLIRTIKKGIDNILRKEQAWFRENRSTIDQIFTLRNILEQVNEWNATLYTHFIDFEKAFDSIHRERLWNIMSIYEIPGELISMTKAIYNNFECAVMEGGETIEWFQVQSGVKQGCTMSGFLFLLSIDWVMNRTAEGRRTGIRWSEISRRTKVQLFETIVRAVLMYGCEAWKLTKTEAKKLDAFQYKCMKRILRIRWPWTISHQQIQESTGVNRTSDEIRRRSWKWIGHIMRKNREEHCVTALE